jgi:FtsH-binding integral membrane protein
MLNLRKKTAATLAGITIGALSLWGVALWQDVSIAELRSILLATLLMLGAIILAAAVVITLFLGLKKLLTLVIGGDNKPNH